MRHHLEALIDPKRVLLVHVAASDVLREKLLAPFTASKALAVTHVRANADGTFEIPRGKFDLAVLLVEDAVMLASVRHATEHGVARAIAAPGDVPAEVSAACQALANNAGVCLLGPHAFGLQRPHLALNASIWPHLARAGGVAMLSQSSSLTSAIVDWAADTQVGFSLVASCGVDDPASLANFLDYCATDPHTSSVVVFMDSAGNSIARARRS
jgi:acetyltransferase